MEEEERRRVEDQKKRDREVADNEAARAKLDAWLKTNGFSTDVNAAKTTGMIMSSTTWPLFTAVNKKDDNAVRLLLRFGANRNQTNKSGQTAQAVAAEKAKNCDAVA